MEEAHLLYAQQGILISEYGASEKSAQAYKWAEPQLETVKVMEMQLLYSKLHDKYTELKMRKESEIEQSNCEQKSMFMNYVSAAEEMIEHLKTANESLQAKINELTDKIIPDRSAEEYQYAEYLKLLIEERQKTKELSEEVERLRNLLQEKSDSVDKNDDSIDGQLKSPYGGSQLRSRDLSEGSAGLSLQDTKAMFWGSN